MTEQVIDGVQALSQDGEVDFGNHNHAQTQDTPSQPTETSTDTDTSKVIIKPVETKPETNTETNTEVSAEAILTGLVKDVLDNSEGEITEEHLKELEKTGMSKGMLETLMKAEVVTREANDNAVFELVGGKEVYEQMAAHAIEHYSDEKLDAYNEALTGGNRELAKMALLTLQADTKAAQSGNPSERISGNNLPNTNGDVFASQNELINAMSHYKYGRDEKYTAEIDAKRAKSKW